MENFQTQYTSEEHGLIITDVRFRPNSNHLATSSFDRTIKLWNAADVSYLSLIGFMDIVLYYYYSSYSNATIMLLLFVHKYSRRLCLSISGCCNVITTNPYCPMAQKVTRCNHVMYELAYKYFFLFVF
jgi:WD40 repeat protein